MHKLRTTPKECPNHSGLVPLRGTIVGVWPHGDTRDCLTREAETAARDQAHAVAVALDEEAVAVVFDRKSSRLCP